MPVNTLKPVPRDALLNILQAKLGLTRDQMQAFRELFHKNDVILNVDGSLKPQTNVSGRTEQIQTTLQNVDSAGKLTSADAVAADGITFGRIIVSALSSGQVDLSKAGVINKTAANIAETSNLKWRSTAHSAANPTNIVITGTDSGGGHAGISFPAFVLRVPTSDGSFVDVSYSGGLAIGLNNSTTYYLFIDDATFAGSGSLVVTTDPNALFSSGSRIYLGSCTTPAGGAGNTTGKPGGMGGGVNRGTVLN